MEERNKSLITKIQKYKRENNATKEQLQHSDYIKSIHKQLRDETKKLGDAELAWKKHLKKNSDLTKYAESMQALSEVYWIKNKDSSQNRINWTVNVCLNYFKHELLKYREKEIEIMRKNCIELNQKQPINSHSHVPSFRRDVKKDTKLRLLDVGSCFNPFEKYTDFEVIAIDIAPSNNRRVYQADFIHIKTSDQDFELDTQHNRIISLVNKYFDCVVFSLLLEYLPTSQQRLICISKAYQVLDNEGILVIITPDSKHIGSNAKLMKVYMYKLY